MPQRVAALLFFVAAGAVSFAAQALLLRECLVLYRGSELAAGVFFGAWLMWIAVGARLGRWLARRGRPFDRTFALLVALYALAPGLQILAVAGARALLGVPAWQLPPLGPLVLLTTLANAPVSLLTGALFTIATPHYAGGEGEGQPSVAARWVTRTYLWEVIGSSVGGLALTALILWGLSTALLLLVLLAVWTCALALSWLLQGRRRPALVALSLATPLLLLIGGPASWGLASLDGALQRYRLRVALPAARLVAARMTPYQHIAVARLGRQRIVLRNGVVAGSYPDEAGNARVAALTMVEHPAARDVLVIGSLATGLARHLLAWGPQTLHWIDDDAVATDLLRRHLLPGDGAALADPRLRRVKGDPRALLARLPHSARFDVIAVLDARPVTALGNRLFTREVYRVLRAQLRPGGVFVTRLGGMSQTHAAPDAGLAATVYRSLRSVFRRVLVLPGSTRWFFAGDERTPLTSDGSELARRLRRSSALPGLEPDALRRRWTAEGVRLLREQLERAEVWDNSDARPVAYFQGLLRRIEQTDASLARWLAGLRRAGLLFWLAPLLLLLLLRLHYVAGQPAGLGLRRVNAIFGLLALGAISMALYLLLLFAFQSRQGAVFEQVGLVGALFMAGIAGGGRWAQRGQGRWRRALLPLLVLAGLLTLLPALVSASSPGATAGLAIFYLLFGVGGAACGGLLPLLVAELAAEAEPTAALASTLEGADHLGGAAAALLAGTLCLPLLGLSGSRWLLLALLAACVLLVLQQRQASSQSKGKLGRWLLARTQPRSFGFVLRLSYALAALVLVFWATSLLLRGELELWQRRFRSDELARLVEGKRFIERAAPFYHYLIDQPPGEKDGARQARAACVASINVASGVRGYGGKLNLLVELDAKQRLGAVHLLRSKETPQYLRGIDRWLRQLRGRTVARPLKLRLPTDDTPLDERTVDVLSGATVTARAVVSAINESSAALDRVVYGRTRASEGEVSQSWARALREPGVRYLLLAFVLALLALRFGGPRVRLLLLAAQVVIGGLWLNLQLSVVDLRRLLLGELPGLAQPSLLLLLLLVGVTTVALGPLYCSGLCPFGAAQELLARLASSRRFTLSPTLDRARYLKYLLLAVSATLLLAGSTAPESADPLALHFGLAAAGRVLPLLLLAVIALGALVSFRPFCRYFCPVGALLQLGNKVRLLGRFWRPRRYDRCDLGVRSQRDVDCLQCDRCVATPRAVEAPSRSLFVGRDRLLAGWLALMLLLLVAMAVQGWGAARSAELPGRGRSRKVDLPELRRRIESGRLSKQPARFVEPVKEQR